MAGGENQARQMPRNVTNIKRTIRTVQTNIPNSTAAAHQDEPPKRTATVDGKSVVKRLQSELMSLMMCGDPGISAFPEGHSILSWVGTITGSKDSVYEGMVFKLSFTFTNHYPFKPPKVKFLSSCFHPNVDASGNICLDIILQDKWSSAYDVRTVLLSIQNLLGEPNNESPLNTLAARFWSNPPQFRKMVETFYNYAAN